jgi:hypothetical protein
MFDTVYIYVPEMKQIIKISEGSGENLLEEDMAEGYVDYIYYEQYAREFGFPEVDGGMVMLTELFRDKYESTKDCIPAVLDMAFGDTSIEHIVLE